MSDYFDLGSYSRKVTGSSRAQTWFDRGLVWAAGQQLKIAAARADVPITSWCYCRQTVMAD